MPHVTTLLCARCSRPAPALPHLRAYLSSNNIDPLNLVSQDANPLRFQASSIGALRSLLSEDEMQDAPGSADAMQVSQATPLSEGGLRAMTEGRHRGYICDSCDTKRMLRRVDRQRGGHGATLEGLRKAAERKGAALRMELEIELGNIKAETRQAEAAEKAEKEMQRMEVRLQTLGVKARENKEGWDDEVKVWEGFGEWMAVDAWSKQGKGGEAASGGKARVWSGWESDSEDKEDEMNEEDEIDEEEEDESMSFSDSDADSDYDSVAAERDELEVFDEGSVDSGTDEYRTQSELGDETELGDSMDEEGELGGPDMQEDQMQVDDEEMADAY